MGQITKHRFKIIGSQDYSFAVSNYSVDEKISNIYELLLNLVSEKQIKMNEMIKKEALLTIAGKYDNRYFHGYINNFMMTGQVGRFFTYQAIVVPYVWFMDLNQNYRIFQDMTVEDIVKKLLRENKIATDEYDFCLKNDYKTRRYCTQYGESDFRFMCRILEEEGIFFFFDHTEDSHTIIFSDTEDIYEPIAGESQMDFNYNSNMVAEKETISSFAYNRSIRPGKITHTNYNFKRPSLDIKLDNEGDTYTNHEIYEYPGDYGLPSEGKPKVQNHLQKVKSLEVSVQGKGNCSRFVPGYTFSVIAHPFEELNGKYCLVSVEHNGRQSGVYGENSGIGGDYEYSNDFIAIPAATVYRTRRNYPKPNVRGIQTAVVTGQEGSEIHTDEWGRVKVRFHWDRGDKKNDKSSCWLRTNQPWSGNGWGFVSLPRVGDEVLVAFINGDPDWPIMIGNVNNAASPALYTLPDNKTQSGIKTRSTPGGGRDNFNELRFEDKMGSEEVYLQAEKDYNVVAKNNRSQDIGGSSGTSIGGDSNTRISKNKNEFVGSDSYSQVTGTRTDIAKEIILSADSQITLVAGGNSIVVSSGDIKINGATVYVNDGSQASAPATKEVSGATCHGGGSSSSSGAKSSSASNASNKSSSSSSTASTSATPTASPETTTATQPASTPSAGVPETTPAVSSVADTPVEEPLADYKGDIPSGDFAGLSTKDIKSEYGDWKISSLTNPAAGAGDLVSSESPSAFTKMVLANAALSAPSGVVNAAQTGDVKGALTNVANQQANQAIGNAQNTALSKAGLGNTGGALSSIKNFFKK